METASPLSVAAQFSLIIEGLLVALAAHLEALLLTPAYRVLMMVCPNIRRELESLCRGLRRDAALLRLELAGMAAPLLPPPPRDDAVGAVANDVFASDMAATGSVTRPTGAWTAPAHDAERAATGAGGDCGGGEIFTGVEADPFHADFVTIV